LNPFDHAALDVGGDERRQPVFVQVFRVEADFLGVEVDGARKELQPEPYEFRCLRGSVEDFDQRRRIEVANVPWHEHVGDLQLRDGCEMQGEAPVIHQVEGQPQRHTIARRRGCRDRRGDKATVVLHRVQSFPVNRRP
jgi:hypothetical protein